MSTRVIRGDTNPIFYPVATAQAVEVGDLVAQVASTIVRAEDTTWGSAIATPGAPTVTNGAVAIGTGLTNGATSVKVSYNTPWGEGTLSAAGTATPTAGAALVVAAVALPANVTSLNIYVETAAGSGIYKLQAVSATGSQHLIQGYGGGRVPPTAVATTALEATQYAFAQAFAGVSGQRKVTTVARIYGNSTDNVIRVDSNGIFQFDTASATYNVGDFLGAAKATGNALLSQQVAAVAGEALAIARVVAAVTSSTTVYGEILSAVTPYARKA